MIRARIVVCFIFVNINNSDVVCYDNVNKQTTPTTLVIADQCEKSRGDSG